MRSREDSTRQIRRRGRPKKQQAVLEHTQKEPEQLAQPATPEIVAQAHVALTDEQLAYTLKEEDLSQFSSYLRHILKHDHMEITRVARELNVAENTIYRWMNGRSEPGQVNLKKLLDVLP